MTLPVFKRNRDATPWLIAPALAMVTLFGPGIAWSQEAPPPAPPAPVAPPAAAAPTVPLPPPVSTSEGPSGSPVRGDEITDAQQAAVERGLAWLAAHQTPDGAGGGASGGFAKHAGITALGGLAFMQAGNLPGRGKYGDNVTRCLDFVLSNCQESGMITSDASHGPMYGHGFATLFLAEVYGMTGRDDVKEPLQRAVRLIQKTQNREGGWRYNPVPYDADISVTICQVMALRAARDAGIKVEKDVIDRAVKYVLSCRNPDGGFAYMAGQGGGGNGPSAFARTAAGVATLFYAGVSEGDAIDRGLRYIMDYVPNRSRMNVEAEGHYYYGHYYAVQATFLAGGDYWKRWYGAIRDELINRQNKTAGNWSDQMGEDYATAMALIVLQMPNRYLPVYTGKGPGS
jgi:hypothetical protein